MNSCTFGHRHSTANPVRSRLSIIKGTKPPVVLSLLFLSLFFPLLVQAAAQPSNQKLQNADFEAGNMTGWAWQGSGWGGVENCCGQHETPFWGKNGNPYPLWPNVYSTNSWDGSVSPSAGGDVQIYQYQSVTQGQKYRLNSWFQTSGLTAYLRRYSASLGALVECGNTANTAHTPLSCEFTASTTESMAFILEQGYGSANQWADSDDWTLTPIRTVPRWLIAETWATLPVLFYADSSGYPTREDIASWNWNDAMGKSMLQRTSNPNQTNIIKIVGVSAPSDYRTAGPLAVKLMALRSLH